MKIFDSRKSIVMASIGVLFAALTFVSCEKREDLDSVINTKYSKYISFTQFVKNTRASHIKRDNQFPNETFVLYNEEETNDSLFLMSYVSDMDSEILTRATIVDEDYLSSNGFNIIAVDANGSKMSNLSVAVSKDGEEWSYTPKKNWSEVGSNTVKFYAYANFPSTGVSEIEAAPTKRQFVMPINSSSQKDVIVAKAANSYNSSSNTVVPLTFNHIFAGVQFVVGDFDAEVGGYIESIRIEGLVGTGTYDMETNDWSGLSAENQKTFTIGDITQNSQAQTKDSQVGKTLMVIPSALGNDAKIVITFKTGQGNIRTLTASLAGGMFEAGKMYTCKINTNKIEYLAFSNVPTVIDAHYVIVPVEVYLQSNVTSATLTAEIGNTNIEMTDDLNDYESRGYWIDNTSLSSVGLTTHENGSISFNRSTTGYTTIYLFVPENITNAPRDITLTLSASIAQKTETATISQFCPTATGCERIEEEPFQPWGPYWEFEEGDGTTVTYTIDKNSAGYNDLRNYMYFMYISPIIGPIFKALLGINNVEGVTPNDGNWWNYDLTTVTIDYGSYLSYNMPAGDNGLSNTQTVFNGSGSVNISQLLEIEGMIENAVADGGVVNEPDKKDFENSAIIGAVKKNKFTLLKQEDLIVLVCPNTDIKWHLPSISEIPNKLQYKGAVGESLVSGSYWSSTPSTGNLAGSHSQVYIWSTTGTGSIINEKRDVDTYKYRAVRVAESGTTFQNATN